MYKYVMEGSTELDAIVSQVPEFEILRMANLSRDLNDPYTFGNKILLDMTLKKEADEMEIDYWLGLLRKREFPLDEL